MISIFISTASATIQVVASNTAQASNNTEYDCIYPDCLNTYVKISTITLTENITGSYNWSFEERQTGVNPVYLRITNDTGVIVSETTHSDTPYTYFNTTQYGTLYSGNYYVEVKSAYSLSIYVRNFRLMYDAYYEPATPMNLSYTYNLTGINFSWLPGTGNVTDGYNVSYTNSYGGWVWSNGTNNYTFISASTGQNINIRIYARNGTTAQSINSSYLSGSVKMVSIYSIGGVGYNWSTNYSWNSTNNAWDICTGKVVNGKFYYTSGCSNTAGWTVSSQNTSQNPYISSSGYYTINDATNNITLLKINSSNYSSTETYARFTVLGGGIDGLWGRFGLFTDALNMNVGADTGYEMIYYSTPRNYILSWSNGAAPVNNFTASNVVSLNSQYNFLAQSYPSNQKLMFWVAGSSPPTSWNVTFTNASYINGSYGVRSQNAAYNIIFYWIKSVDSSGNRVLSGNHSLILDASTIYGNVNDKFSGLGANLTVAVCCVSVNVSMSDDNISWDSETQLFNNTNSTIYRTPSTKRYIRINTTITQAADGLTTGTLQNYLFGVQTGGQVSGYVKYSNGTGIPSAKVLWADETVLTEANGSYQLDNISIGNISIVAGISGYYPFGELFYNTNGTNTTTNLNFTLSEAPAENPNQLNTLSYNITRDYSPYLSSMGHLVDLPYSETQYEGYSEGMLAEIFSVNVQSSNFTPEYLEAGLRLTNHLSYDVIRPNNFGMGANHGTELSNQTAFILMGAIYAMRNFHDFVSTSQYEEWNTSVKAVVDASYESTNSMTNSITASSTSTGYLNSNWHTMFALAERERQMMCGACVNDTRIQNIIQKYNNSVTVNGYPQGAELSSNYNTVLYTMFRMFQETGYDSSILNNTLNLHRPAVLNASLQDGQVMSYYRSAGQTASYAQNIYNLMRETENRGQAYRYADLQYQKIAAFPDDISGVGYYPSFHFYNPSLQVGFEAYNRQHLQNTITGMFMARAAVVYDNSIVEAPRVYYPFYDLEDGEIISDALYNSSGVLIINPENYSIYTLGKFEIYTDGILPYGNGTVVMPGIPIISVSNAQNYTINPMPEVGGGFLGDSRDNSYTFPVTFNNRTIRTSLNFTASRVYSDVTNESIRLNITNLNYTTKFVQSYNLTTEYNATANAIDVIINLTWDNTTYPLTHFEYGIPFIVDDNRTQATIMGDASSRTIDFNRGADTVNISNIQFTNATELSINTSTGLIGYVPFGKSEITTIEGTITQSPVTIRYTHKVSTTNVYGYALNQPPSLIASSPETPVNITSDSSTTFEITTSQLTTVNWYLNESLVQTNISVLTSSYFNNTPDIGNYTIRAHYENAQGQNNHSWEWNVAQETIPPASITNNQTVTGNFWINNTWTNPVDADFNHTYWAYQNGTQYGSNLSNSTTYLNLTWSPHATQNISAQTVDTSGNVNSTKVWFNATIPNNEPVLESIGNKTVTAGEYLNFTISANDSDIVSSTQTYIEINNGSINDTYISNHTDSVNTNFNSAISLMAGNNNLGGWVDYYTLLKFTHSLNSTDIISNATLRVYMIPLSGSNPLNLTIQRLTQSWNDSNVTWNTKPSNDSVNWSYKYFPDDTVGYYDFDITNLLQSWVNGTYPNYGIQIMAYDYNTSYKLFTRTEADNEYAPYILINLTYGETLTYGTNASNGTLNTSTGVYSWLTTSGDVGVYNWYFNVSDGYGGVDTENITVTITTNNNILNCTTISSSGEYNLLNNIINTSSYPCITISASNVTFYGNGYIIDGIDAENSGGIYLYNSSQTITNVTVRDLILSDWTQGIYFTSSINNSSAINNTVYSATSFGIRADYSNLNSILENNVSNNIIGIRILESSNFTIKDNIVNSTVQHGIRLFNSSYTNVSENIVSSGNDKGISIDCGSSHNIIYGNNITAQSGYGISLAYSGCGTVPSPSNNTIYNNFLNNTYNHYDANSSGIWNITKISGSNIIGGSYIGGNYWSNPSSSGFSQTCINVDGDGICDSAYTDGTKTDNHPLTLIISTTLYPSPITLGSCSKGVTWIECIWS